MKAIVFDFDGTVADTLPLIFHCFRMVFHKYAGRNLSDKEIVGMFGPHEEAILQEHIQPQVTVRAVEDFYSEYRSQHERLVHNDQAIIELLQQLAVQGIKLGIVTGKGRRSAELSLEYLNLRQLFEVIITGDDVEQPKPHPEGILLALRRLGVNAAEAIYVGDSNADILAAKAAGVMSIGVHWLGTSQESRFSAQPDYYVTNTAEFLAVITETS